MSIVHLMAAGLSRPAAVALSRLGIQHPDALRDRPWMGEDGLRALLRRHPDCSPKAIAGIARWLSRDLIGSLRIEILKLDAFIAVFGRQPLADGAPPPTREQADQFLDAVDVINRSYGLGRNKRASLLMAAPRLDRPGAADQADAGAERASRV